MSQILVKFKFAKSPELLEDMSLEQLDLTEDTEESHPENDFLIEEFEANMMPVAKWMRPEIPLGPQTTFERVRVTHIDENGQIVR